MTTNDDSAHHIIFLDDTLYSSSLLREKYGVERKALKAIPFFPEIAQLFAHDPIMYSKAIDLMPLDNIYVSEGMRCERIWLKAIGKEFNVMYFVCDEWRTNREFVKKALKVDGRAFEHIDKQFVHDQQFVRIAIENGYGDALEFADEELKRDRELVLKAIRTSKSAFSHCYKIWLNDREIVLEAAKQNPIMVIMVIGENLKKDREILETAAKVDGSSIQFAAKFIRNDRELILESIGSTYISGFTFASSEIQNDREFVLQAVRRNGKVLSRVFQKFQSDKEIVLEAVRQSGDALKYAHESLQDDLEVVTEAITKEGSALMFASDRFKRDRDMTMLAVSSKGYAIYHVHESLRSDTEIIRKAIKICPGAILFSPEWYNEKKLVLEAIHINPETFEYAVDKNPNLLERELILEYFKLKVNISIFCPEHLKRDRSFVLEAVKLNGSAFFTCGEYFKHDREIIMEGILTYNFITRPEYKYLLTEDRKFLLEMIEKVNSRH